MKKILFVHPWMTIAIILVVNVLLRILFIFYGYIATEEGELIINQRMAYQGYLPFVDYNAWNSLLHDYLIGWYQFFLAPTIINQRIIGLFLAVTVFIITLAIAYSFGKWFITLVTALAITFGSYDYTYISTVPYSEQTMTVLLMASLFFISLKTSSLKKRYVFDTLVLLFLSVSIVVRTQAVFPALMIWLYIAYQYRRKMTTVVKITIPSVILTILLSAPFFLRSIDHFVYSIIWPIQIDKIIIYQVAASYSLTSFLLFVQEVFRNYAIFLLFIPPVLVLFLWNKKLKGYSERDVQLFILFFLVSLSLFFSGILHKPPNASYLYPATPSLALVLGITWYYFIQISSKKETKLFILFVLLFGFLSSGISFPHYKIIKTAWNTRFITPHQYLSVIAAYVQAHSQEHDEILSFYAPLTVVANRQVPENFNLDRYSVSLLPSQQAAKYHLMSHEMLMDYIGSKKAKIIAFSEKNMQNFGKDTREIHEVLNQITANYILGKEFPEIAQIENPKTLKLFMYIRKS